MQSLDHLMYGFSSIPFDKYIYVSFVLEIMPSIQFHMMGILILADCPQWHFKSPRSLALAGCV